MSWQSEMFGKPLARLPPASDDRAAHVHEPQLPQHGMRRTVPALHKDSRQRWYSAAPNFGFVSGAIRPMIAAMITRLFYSLTAFMILPLTTAAETFTGAAAVEKVRALYKDKKLKLITPGDSAEKVFAMTIYPLDKDVAIQVYGSETGALAVMRSGKDHLPCAISGRDWSLLVNGTEPGTLLYLPGAGGEAALNGKERKLLIGFTSLKVDPSFDASFGCDVEGMLPPEMEAGTEWKLETGEKEWLLTETTAAKQDTAIYRLDPAAAWPLREKVTASKEGSVALVIQTGAEVPEAWRKVTPEALFALGRPVRTQQSSPLQWKQKESPEFSNSPEGEAYQRGLARQMIQRLDKVKDMDAAEPAAQEAARAVAGLLPPPLPVTLTLPGVKPAVYDYTGDGQWMNHTHPLPEDADVMVPLEFQGHTPCVRVKFKSGEYLLALDTGAPDSSVEEALVSEEVGNGRLLSSPRGRDLHSKDTETLLGRVPEASIGGWQLKNGVFQLGPKMTGVGSQGLLGRDILRLHPFTIDWPAGRLTFHRRTGFRPPEGAAEFPLKDSRLGPQLGAVLEGVGPLEPVVDTGLGGTLLLSEGLAAKHSGVLGRLRRVKTGLAAPRGAVIGDRIQWPQGSALEAGGIQLDRGFGIFQVKEVVDGLDCLLGAEFFRDARVTFDFENGKLYVLQPPRRTVKERLAGGWKLEAPDVSGLTPLGRALSAGDRQECEELAAAGASLKVSKDQHAMETAVISGDPALVEWVAAQDKAGGWKKTPALFEAIKRRAPDIARWLLEHGAEQAANKEALCAAAGAGDLATAVLLRKAGWPFNFEDADGKTVYSAKLAIAGQQPEFLRWILNEDGEALRGRKLALTAYAAGEGGMECVKVLLDAGFDPLERDSNGNTALHFAAAINNIAMLTLLLDRGCPPDAPGSSETHTPLISAATYGQAGAVKLLLSRHAAVEGPRKNGEPLNVATRALGTKDAMEDSPLIPPPDYPGVVRALLEAGAGFLRRESSYSPAEIFAGYDHGLAKLCVEKGATPETAPGMLRFATMLDRGETVEFLIAKGWNPWSHAAGENPAFYSALNEGKTGVIRAMLANGAKKPLEEEIHALNTAARHNDAHLIAMLAAAGGDVNAEDDAGRTPLAVAVEWRAFSAVRALLAAGADPQRKSGDGTPLEAAARLEPKYPALEEYLRAAVERK